MEFYRRILNIYLHLYILCVDNSMKRYDKISMQNHPVEIKHQEFMYFFIDCSVLVSFTNKKWLEIVRDVRKSRSPTKKLY